MFTKHLINKYLQRALEHTHTHTPPASAVTCGWEMTFGVLMYAGVGLWLGAAGQGNEMASSDSAKVRA